MTNRVIATKIVDGPTAAVIHYFVESDGVVGEMERVVIMDPQVDFDPTVEKVSIVKIWSSLAVFDGLLEFNALEPIPVWVMSPEAGPELCFREFGGLKDKSTVASDGKLMLSTSGFAPAGSKGTFVITYKKN